MDITEGLKFLARNEGQTGLQNVLGMKFFATDDPDTIMATMPVNEKSIQPYGTLCGGATLALGEILAGVGSVCINPECNAYGMNVSCSHVHSALPGEIVTATARILHAGHRSHVWQVEVRDKDNALISSMSVTNFISKKK